MQHLKPDALGQVRVQWLCPKPCVVVLEYWSIGALQNIKSQAPNYNEIPNSNIQ
jgi:hypothetical protein